MLPLLLTWALVATPQEPALPDPTVPDRGIEGLDVAHYRLELAIDGDRRFVEGRAILTLSLDEARDQLPLDFHHMFEVVSVRVDGQLCEHEQRPHRLLIAAERTIPAATPTEVEIQYRGLFPQDESQGDVVGMLHDGVSVVAYLEPDGAHHWFPCNDHPSDKATYELIIDVPEGQVAAGIGALIDEPESPLMDHVRSHWRTEIPTATYLVALGVGPWVRIEREGARVPIWDYCEEEDRERIERSLAVVPRMMNFFEERFGPYPFEKYGHMLTRQWIGGMEDQTLTVLGREEALSGNPALLAHELAHQWFGNLVSPRQWKDLWLNEGWATWAELLWFETENPTAAAQTREGWRRSTFRLAMREHPHTLAHPDPANLFDGALVYDKGGMVIDLLDGYLGRERFLHAARQFLARHATSNASTADFRQALEDATGEDLGPFFAAWVEANTLPVLDWEFLSLDALGRTATGEDAGPWRVRVRAAQVDGHHPMSLALELQGQLRSERHRLPVRFAEPIVEFELVVPWKPRRAVFDPDKRTPWVPAEPSDR